MDYIKSLEADLEKGYSKSDLEKLIGLPKNNLSGILKGSRKLSKKSQLKIDKWEASEKPHPLSVNWVKEFSDNMLPVTGMEFFEEKPTVGIRPISSPIVGKTVTVTLNAKDHFIAPKEETEWQKTQRMERIVQLEKELKNIPTKLLIPRKAYISIREQELAKLKSN